MNIDSTGAGATHLSIARPIRALKYMAKLTRPLTRQSTSVNDLVSTVLSSTPRRVSRSVPGMLMTGPQVAVAFDAGPEHTPFHRHSVASLWVSNWAPAYLETLSLA